MSDDDNYSTTSQSTQDRNFLAPGGAISPSSTLPRAPSPGLSQAGDGTSTLRVARVIPTPRPATSSPLAHDSAQPEDNYNSSSSDESGTDDHDAHAMSTAEQDDDLGNGDHFGNRARHHQCFRLNTLEVSGQSRQARVIPNRYASIRLHTSKSYNNYYDCSIMIFISPFYRSGKNEFHADYTMSCVSD